MRSDRSPRSDRPGPGRVALRLGAALLLAGLALASPSLIVPGLALVAMAPALSLGTRLAARGAAVRRGPVPTRIVEGEPFALTLALRSGRLPMLARLREPLLGPEAAVRHVRPRDDFELRRDVALARRGLHRLESPALRFGDPLGISARDVEGSGRSSVLVLPRIEAIRGPDGTQGPAGRLLIGGPGERAAAGGHDAPADPELDGLRPYRSSSPASRIYWPALARGDELLERRLAPAGGAGPHVVLDATGMPGPDALDAAVRAAASICRHLGRYGGCELVLPGGQRLAIDRGAASWDAAHAALALVEATHSPPPVDGAPGTELIWIGLAAGLPRGADGYLVTPEPLGDRPASFTVAGCCGYRLRGAAGRGLRASAVAA